MCSGSECLSKQSYCQIFLHRYIALGVTMPTFLKITKLSSLFQLGLGYYIHCPFLYHPPEPGTFCRKCSFLYFFLLVSPDSLSSYPTANRWIDSARRLAIAMGITKRASLPLCSPPMASVVWTMTLWMVRQGPWSSPHHPGEMSNARTASVCSASRLVFVVSHAYCCACRFRPACPRSVTASYSPLNAWIISTSNAASAGDRYILGFADLFLILIVIVTLVW